MYIDKKYSQTETVHRNITGPNVKPQNGVLSSGFMMKNSSYKYTTYRFEHYVGVYILRGYGKYVDEDDTEYELCPGSFIQRLPRRIHSTYIDFSSGWLEFFVAFGRSAFEGMAQTGAFDDVHPVLYTDPTQEILSQFDCFLQDLRMAKNDELPFMLLEAQRLLCTINQMSKQYKKGSTSFAARACKHIRDNIKVGTDMKKLAKELGVGYESFRKQFKSAVGVSPCEYMISERINAAKIMMLDQKVPIKEVSFKLGYNDVFAFSRQFKQYTGITPGEFLRH